LAHPVFFDPFYVAIYFNELARKDSTLSFLTAALCGIRWGHISSGFDSPTNHPFTKLAFEGAKRIISQSSPPITKKEPFTPELLKQIVSMYGSSDNLLNIRFLIICLLGFAGFLRISELLQLKVGDLTFDMDGVKINITKSKTDQLHEGSIVYVSKLANQMCPVFWLSKYLSLT